MPLSLKTMLKKFAHKGQITQEEYDALIKKLEGHDKEIRNKAIDEFEKEIVAEYDNDACPNVTDYLDYKISLRDLFRIADELKAGAD